MKQLPPSQNQMTSMLQQAVATGDVTEWERAIEFGYRLINTMYRPDPIRRPFDLFRRQKAYQWWDQQVRLTGQKMGLVIMEAQLRKFRSQMMRPIQEEEEEYAIQRGVELEVIKHGHVKARIEREATELTWRNQIMRPVEDEAQDHIEGRRRDQETYEDTRQQGKQRQEDKRQRKLQKSATTQQIQVAEATARAQAEAQKAILREQAALMPPDTSTRMMQEIQAIEDNPALSQEQKDRRFDVLLAKYGQPGGTR